MSTDTLVLRRGNIFKEFTGKYRSDFSTIYSTTWEFVQSEAICLTLRGLIIFVIMEQVTCSWMES